MPDPTPPVPPGDSSSDPLLERCILAFEDGRQAEIDEVMAQYPERASELRQRLQELQELGILAPPTRPAIPKRLGDFELLRPLGHGGMGFVFLARQESLQREVALKLVRPEQLYFPGARERFRREVLAVARLEHPGIVPVYTFGEADGVPFYAMQRLHGVSLGELLHALAGASRDQIDGGAMAQAFVRAMAKNGAAVAPPQAPLFEAPWGRICCQLVRDMALALQHAHEHGVLHRDVKPSNVMLTGDGGVHLIDFGLASTAGGDRITRTGAAVGSLPYMAPEQVRGNVDDIDARTDVYALGVTLYELLTLSLPFGDGSGTTRERILQGRVEAPSLRNARVHADAEAICLQAMETDPRRRYQEAAALAADLGRFLAFEPVLARRQTAGLKFSRWVRRHPSRFAALLLGGLLVAGGPLVFGLQEHFAAQRIQSALDQTRAQERRAVANLGRALAAVDTMLARTAVARLGDVPRTAPLQRQLLEDALQFLEALAATETSPLMLEERARTRRRVGQIRLELGDVEGALAALQQAVVELRQLLATGAAAPRLSVELAEAQRSLASSFEQLGKVESWQQALAAELVERQRLAAAAPGDTDLQLALHAARIRQVSLLVRQGSLDQAMQQVDELELVGAPALAEPLAGEVRERWLLTAARIADARGLVLTAKGESQAAQRAFTAAMQRYELSAAAENGRGRIELANLQQRLAQLANQRREWEEARPLLDAAVASYERLVQDEPEAPAWQLQLAVMLGDRADNRSQLGAPKEALVDLDRAVATLEQACKRFHDQPGEIYRLANALGQRAIAHIQLREMVAARADFTRSTGLFDGLLAQKPDDAAVRASLIGALKNQSMAEAQMGELEPARRTVERALQLLVDSNFGEVERSRIEVLSHASDLAMHDRDVEHGEAYMLEACERAEAWLAEQPDDPLRQGTVAMLAINHGTLELMRYNLEGAAAIFAAALPAARSAAKVGTANRRTLAALLLRLCDVEVRLERPEAARKWFAAAVAEAGAQKAWFTGMQPLQGLFDRPEFRDLLPVRPK